MAKPQQHKAAPGRGGHPARRRARKASPRPETGMEDPNHGFSHAEWHDMVSTAAYFRAQARGDGGGSADEDWYEAEAELRERFGAAESNVEGGSDASADDIDLETKGEQAWQT